MTRRAPAVEPRLPGYQFRRHLGSGGFADVYLYEDVRTSREVAVKVLLADSLAPGVRDRFESEARLMGRLSTHPSIVTIYHTGIAPDGRPYLVMEYCSEPPLGARFRTRPLDLPRALEVTVEICGAVETAHRAGILHRDIKPANILVSDYGKAMLADFGISAALGGDDADQGLSVPWAPPEFIEGRPGGRESDVWSLAATLYSLLEGRAPFEIPGQDRSARAQMERILHDPLPPMSAPGIPPFLEQTLSAAMAKDPGARYATALELGHALRHVQAALHLPESTLLVRAPRSETTEADPVPPPEPPETDGTVLRERSVSPEVTPRPRTSPSAGRFVPGGGTAHPITTDDSGSETASRVAPLLPAAEQSGAVTGTIARGPAPTGPSGDPAGRRRRVAAGASLAVVTLIVGAVVWAVTATGDDEPPRPAETSAAAGEPGGRSAAPARTVVPAVVALEGTSRGDDAEFEWTNPEPEDGDTYLWNRTGTGGVEDPRETRTTRITVPGGAGACIEVFLVRASGRTSAEGAEGCAR